jgi:hypothetical protein
MSVFSLKAAECDPNQLDPEEPPIGLSAAKAAEQQMLSLPLARWLAANPKDQPWYCEKFFGPPKPTLTPHEKEATEDVWSVVVEYNEEEIAGRGKEFTVCPKEFEVGQRAYMQTFEEDFKFGS